MNIEKYMTAVSLLSRNQGATVKELAARLDVTERQVHKIFEDFETKFEIDRSSHDSVYPRRIRFKCTREAAKNFLEGCVTDMDFSEEDKAAFNYLLSNAQNTPAMEEAMRHLLHKVSLMAGERGSVIETGLNKTSPIRSVKSIQKNIDSKKVSAITKSILKAIKAKHLMDLTYKSVNGERPRPWYGVFPLVMFMYGGDPYVYVVTPNGKLWMFAIERIVDIKSDYEGAIPEHNYNINELLSDPFGINLGSEPFKVKCLISAREAKYLKEKKWPKGVTLTENEDKTLIFEATTRDSFDCKRWVLAAFPHIKVLEPQWLKEEILETLEQGLDSMKG